MPKKEPKGSAARLMPGCLLGAAVTLALSALLLALPAALIASGRVGEGAAMTMTAAAAFLAACAGALTAKIKNGGSPLSAILAALLAAAVRLLVMFISDRSTSFDSGDAWVLAAMLAGGALVWLTGRGGRRRRR